MPETSQRTLRRMAGRDPAEAGVDMVWALAVLALVPWVTVVGYESVGHRRDAEVLAALEGPA